MSRDNKDTDYSSEEIQDLKAELEELKANEEIANLKSEISYLKEQKSTIELTPNTNQSSEFPNRFTRMGGYIVGVPIGIVIARVIKLILDNSISN